VFLGPAAYTQAMATTAKPMPAIIRTMQPTLARRGAADRWKDQRGVKRGRISAHASKIGILAR
jgi:hypothetical protein